MYYQGTYTPQKENTCVQRSVFTPDLRPKIVPTHQGRPPTPCQRDAKRAHTGHTQATIEYNPQIPPPPGFKCHNPPCLAAIKLRSCHPLTQTPWTHTHTPSGSSSHPQQPPGFLRRSSITHMAPHGQLGGLAMPVTAAACLPSRSLRLGVVLVCCCTSLCDLLCLCRGVVPTAAGGCCWVEWGAPSGVHSLRFSFLTVTWWQSLPAEPGSPPPWLHPGGVRGVRVCVRCVW